MGSIGPAGWCHVEHAGLYEPVLHDLVFACDLHTLLARPLLFVDDEPDFLASMELLLGAHGYEVHPAHDGNRALELLRNGLRPAAVLLDFRMPGMDGGQTLSQIRQLGIAVPAVLVSAVLEVERVAADHGFDAALPKPLSIDDLLQVVNQLVP